MSGYIHRNAEESRRHARKLQRTFIARFFLTLATLMLVAYLTHRGFLTVTMAFFLIIAVVILGGMATGNAHGAADQEEELTTDEYADAAAIAEAAPAVAALLRSWTLAEVFLTKRDLAELRRVHQQASAASAREAVRAATR